MVGDRAKELESQSMRKVVLTGNYTYIGLIDTLIFDQLLYNTRRRGLKSKFRGITLLFHHLLTLVSELLNDFCFASPH